MKKNLTASGQKGRQDGRSGFLGIVADIFILLILVGQILVYHDYYFDIIQTKYYYFCACAIGMLVLFLGYGLVKLGPSKIGQWHKILPARLKEWRKGKSFWDIFSVADVMVILFSVIVVISTVLSPFPFEAFWGNEGRYTGAFLLLLNSAVFFCVSRCYKVKSWHIQMFLIAGMAMCLLGITDYFGMDLLHFKENIVPDQKNSFTSFIGNVNTYTACVALVMAMSGVLFASSKHVVELIWYGVCVSISFFAMTTGQSDNAYLAMLAFFGFMPLYLFRNWRGLCRYCLLLAMCATAVQVTAWTQVQYPEAIRLTGMFQTLTGYEKLPVIVKYLWKLTVAVYAVGIVIWGIRKLYAVVRSRTADAPKQEQKAAGETKRRPAWIARAWWLVIAVVVAAAAFAVYDATIVGNAERYGVLQKYVQFNDSWGTSRGYAWRIAVEGYKKYPPLQKIFGYGPDTYALVTWFNNKEEMVTQYHVRFDSVHNEFLQIFVTIGPFGLLSYLGILVATAWRAVRRHLENPYIMGAVFAVLCYSVQAVVNINQPIASPVMWVLLCISVAEPAAPWKWPWKKK